MRAFSDLLEVLLFSPRRTVKLAHLMNWIRSTDDPDRGWGLAALTCELSFSGVKSGVVRELAEQVTDPDLFALSYDFVGDLAETVALLWPDSDSVSDKTKPSLSEVVGVLTSIRRKDAVLQLSDWMNNLKVSERWALLKLATGGMRVGVSARLVRVSLAQAYDKNVSEIEQIWPLLEPPYATLFDWLEGRAEKPDAAGRAVFHPVMLAAPIDEKTLCSLNLEDWQIEWKWDGARIQLVSAEEGVRLFSRS
ncbi:MAG: ATP-dependent DNA ligase, partial [Candidatus Puniceispirillaceae bacterium]